MTAALLRLLNNRRARVMRHAIAHRTTGGGTRMFLRNVLGPRCAAIARRHIVRIEEDGAACAVWFTGRTDPLYIPHELDRHSLHQIVTELFDQLNWHYYEIPATPVRPDDVVFDCGAAEGLFAYRTYQRAGTVYCFEPMPDFLDCLHRTFGAVPNVHIVGAALGSSTGRAWVQRSGIASFITAQPTPHEVTIISIDDFCREQNVTPTYIKADLEGFELEMLRGAADTIRRAKPAIAITAYHKPRDADHMTEFLAALRPDYNFRRKGIEAERGEPMMLHAW